MVQSWGRGLCSQTAWIHSPAPYPPGDPSEGQLKRARCARQENGAKGTTYLVELLGGVR